MKQPFSYINYQRFFLILPENKLIGVNAIAPPASDEKTDIKENCFDWWFCQRKQ